MLGAAWAAASVFVLPAIAAEPGIAGPVAALTRSAELLRGTWGEGLTGYAGLKAASLATALFLFALPGIGAFAAWHFRSRTVAAVAAVAWLMAALAAAAVFQALGRLYTAALYLFATEGTVAAPFTAETLTAAWKKKKARALRRR
jgi:hypothetical protein